MTNKEWMYTAIALWILTAILVGFHLLYLACASAALAGFAMGVWDERRKWHAM